MSVQQRRQYDPEFKKNAVLLKEEQDRSVVMWRRVLVFPWICCTSGGDNTAIKEK